MGFAPQGRHHVGMHPSDRQRSSSSLGWFGVAFLCGVAVLLLQAGHPAFGWACLLAGLALVGYARGD